MDLPVEATLHLNVFHNKAKVREILWSQDFQLTDLSSDRVRVKGSFLKLKAVKMSLEQLLDAQAEAYNTSPPKASSGAISKSNSKHNSLIRSKKGQDKPQFGSLPLPNRSPSRASVSPNKHAEDRSSDRRGSVKHERESFIIDADVFAYADRLQKGDIKAILHNHGVTMEERQVGNNFNITVLGENAKIAASELQNRLNDLRKSLRTQEVLLKEMGSEGHALLERIQNNKNIENSVLVCRMNDRLHLIGPSKESYELKLGLLAGRRGRWNFRSFKKSSYSLSQILQKNRARDDQAIADPAPKGAAGYSPPKRQDDIVAKHVHAHSPERRSQRGRINFGKESKRVEERDHVQEGEQGRQPPRSAKAFFKRLFTFENPGLPKWRKGRKKDK
ncbi:uncharacterized protein si:dkey-154b15.1 [Centropristis striata]|uniref:uncharacterized protein si:dkey-154b15.1 n=1 Tax=Centropristis striata TaxID=184440 RepID=UPI0027DF3B33|nr:uncharacterized protein si:dkey-154b15.1 [Centropristis striata]